MRMLVMMKLQELCVEKATKFYSQYENKNDDVFN
jgi:hypothetical protein